MLTDLGSRAIGSEIVEQSPTANLQFRGTPMPVKETRAEEPAGQRLHMAVNHIARTMGIRIVESQNEGFSLGTQFFDGC